MKEKLKTKMDKKLFNKIKKIIKEMPISEFRLLSHNQCWFNFDENGELIEYFTNPSGSPLCVYSQKGNHEECTKSDFYYELEEYYNN